MCIEGAEGVHQSIGVTANGALCLSVWRREGSATDPCPHELVMGLRMGVVREAPGRGRGSPRITGGECREMNERSKVSSRMNCKHLIHARCLQLFALMLL